MAINKVFWPIDRDFITFGPTVRAMHYQGYDIHVLRNGVSTEDLRKYILVTDTSTSTAFRLIDALASGTVDKAEFLPTLEIPADPPGIPTAINGQDFNNGDSSPLPPSFKPAGKALFALNDVTIDTYSGEVIANTSTEPDYLKNFNFVLVVRITVGSNTYETAVRIRVHEEILHAWITPKTLTVQENETSRCSIYAQFGEGVVGDISHHPGITWTMPSNVTIKTSTSSEQTGEFTVGTKPAGGVISATLPASLALPSGNSVRTGEIIVEDDWATASASRPKVDVIAAKTSRLDRVPNFLFISDGYLAGQKSDFESLTDDIYARLLSETVKHPWNDLRDSVNWFRLFVPSKESGNSVLNEYIRIQNFDFFNKTGSAAFPIDFASKKINETIVLMEWSIYEYIKNVDDSYFEGRSYPSLSPYRVIRKHSSASYPIDITTLMNTGITELGGGSVTGTALYAQIKTRINTLLSSNYNLGNKPSKVSDRKLNLFRLITKVGYPTPADKSLSRTSMISNKWRKLFDDDFTHTNTSHDLYVSPDLYEFWIGMAERRMLDEVDSEFSTCLGIKPREDFQNEGMSPNWLPIIPTNPLDPIGPYGALTSFFKKAGQERGAGFHKKSRPKVDALLKDIEISGTTEDMGNRWVFDSLSGVRGKDYDFLIFIQNNTRFGGVRIGGDDFTIGIFVNAEEKNYLQTSDGSSIAGGTSIPKRNVVSTISPSTKVTDTVFGIVTHEPGHAFNLDDEYAGNSGAYPNSTNALNVQERSGVLDGSDISGNNLKWRWLRLANAGLTIANPDPESGTSEYFLQMETGHTNGFTIGEKVFLRKRKLIPRANPMVQIDSEFSGELEISDITTDNKVKVKFLTPTDAGNFGSGSVLVKLVSARRKCQGQVTIAGDIVTGTGTIFGVQVNEVGTGGATIEIGGSPYTVLEVLSNTSMKLTTSPGDNTTPQDFYRTPADKYAELLNYSFRQSINANKRSMTADVTTGEFDETDLSNSGNRQNPEIKNLLVDATNSSSDSVYSKIPTSSVPVTNHRNVISIYDGGDEYFYGIYHPTGYCHMRNNVDASSGFCQVCRYVLVDRIDPSKHNVGVENYSQNYYPEI